jgi:hypothetical protein
MHHKRQEKATMEQQNEQTIITENFAIRVYKTGRGVIAEVADSHSPFNGVYVLASVRAYAVSMLLDKVAELRALQVA